MPRLSQNGEGALFYAMKQVKGVSWEDVLSGNSIDENLVVLMRVADAVAFAHSRGVIHRDLKPENVMLGDFGEVLLMDWGLAAAVGDGAKADPLDPDNAIGGTPCYMAPEMAVGDTTKIGFVSDVYLLGAILFEIVTGKRPHTGKDVMACLVSAADNEIVETDREHELLDISLKAMATEPECRYGSVKAFQESLRGCQRHGESISLTNKALEGLKLAEKEADYSIFARTVFQFEEARSLWAENSRAESGVMKARLAYAKCALEKRDYELAMTPRERSALTSKKLIELISLNLLVGMF